VPYFGSIAGSEKSFFQGIEFAEVAADNVTIRIELLAKVETVVSRKEAERSSNRS
jgi:hypothetical protein